MNKLIITTRDVGEKYLNVLKKTVNIRKQRRKIYGDDFSHPIDVEVWHIYQKTFRMLNLYKATKENAYEKLEDTLRDIINYSLFLLIKLENKK